MTRAVANPSIKVMMCRSGCETATYHDQRIDTSAWVCRRCGGTRRE